MKMTHIWNHHLVSLLKTSELVDSGNEILHFKLVLFQFARFILQSIVASVKLDHFYKLGPSQL